MKFLLLSLFTLLLGVLNIFVGSVDIPATDVWSILRGTAPQSAASFIILESRVPMALTALLAGAGLAASGLMLQTAFRNPLAGPSVLGINSGASLGVALVMLWLGGSFTVGSMTVGGYAAVMLGAFVGSLLIMALLLGLSTLLRNSLMLLITGIMIGYLASSLIALLNFSSGADSVREYVMWGMSSFNGVSLSRMPLFAVLSLVGIGMSLALIKPLNLLLLGENYARNLGLNTRRVRNLLLLSTGLLTAVVTAFCGPVSFIGLSVPHIARLVFPTDNHRVLLPATLLVGAAVALGCNLLCVLPENSLLPLNAVTPLIGAPVVIWVLLKHRAK